MLTENTFGNIGLRVMEGIQLLDQRAEGWRGKINIKTLRTDSAADCPLAQIFGSYELGCANLRFNQEVAAEYGFQATSFDADEMHKEHEVLTKKWKELVPAT